ncbi:MAG: hypothetical protein EBS06_04735 [Proteobacteria bacterium]|nr:hypothetical protein [Pseudomonadota bacterium]
MTKDLYYKHQPPMHFLEDAKSDLAESCKRGYLERVKQLLENMTAEEINTPNSSGETFLMIACKNAGMPYGKNVTKDFYPTAIYNRTKIVELLLEKGADPSIADEAGRTALMKLSLLGFDCQYVEENLKYKSVRSRKIESLSFDGKIYQEGQEFYEKCKAEYKEYISAKNREEDNENAYKKIKEYVFYANYIADEEDLRKAKKEIQEALNTEKQNIATQIIEALIKYGADINKIDKNGKTALEIANERGDKVLNEILLEHGAKNIKQEEDLKDYKTTEDERILDAIFEGNLKNPFLKKNEMVILSHFAITIEDKADKDLKKELLLEFKFSDSKEGNLFKDKKDLNDFIKFARADIFIGLARSEEIYNSDKYKHISGGNFEGLEKLDRVHFLTKKVIGAAIMREGVKENLIACEAAKKIIYDKKIILSSGNNIEIFKASWGAHSAYFIIESDAQSNPIKVSYCDAPNQNYSEIYGYGEIIFKLSENKVSLLDNMGKDPVEKLKIYLSEITNHRAQKSSIDQAIESIKNNLTDSDETNSVEYKIPTKPQKRDNCVLKSFNILLRAVLNKIYPELVFEVDGKPEGNGYKIYKDFKESLIGVYIKDLQELNINENNNKFWYQDLVSRLQEADKKIEKKIFNKSLTQSEIVQPTENGEKSNTPSSNPRITSTSRDQAVNNKNYGQIVS